MTFPNNTKVLGTTNAVLNIDCASGAKQVIFQTAGVNRFIFRAVGTEAGGNSGSDFELNARNDAGAQIGTGLRIVRATLDAEFRGNVSALADNTKSCGTASGRWSQVFAGTGTINTSDAREKTALAPITEGVKRAVRKILGEIGVFRWLAAVAAKGESEARLHIGVTAQAVRDAFAAEGEDAARWALFCADPVFEEIEVETAEIVREPVMVSVTEVAYVDEPDRVVRRVVERLRPVYEDAPLMDEAGVPVLDAEGAPVMVRRVKTVEREVRERTIERRAVLDETGAPATRLGLRHDQLILLALATLAGP